MSRYLIIMLTIASMLATRAGAYDSVHYQDYRAFHAEYFGAEKDDLYYQHFGYDLRFLSDQEAPGNFWLYASVNSASIGFSTNLPAVTWVEYGPNTNYGSTTEAADANYFVHMHQINGLSPGTTYHYRLVARDERFNTIYSPDATFTTGTMAGKIDINGTLSGPPYVLGTGGGHYVLTGDVVAQQGGIFVNAANITVDLNGYTVYYDNGTRITDDMSRTDATYGIWMNYRANTKVFNGRVVSGASTPGRTLQGSGYAGIRFNRWDCEIAGVKVIIPEYSIAGIFTGDARNHVHHNVAVNAGRGVYNRHHQEGAIRVNHGVAEYNLVKRSPHAGILTPASNSGFIARGNEVHVYSCAINSVGVSASNGATISNNKVFGTGHHLLGISWALSDVSHNISYLNNFVHLVGGERIPNMTEVGGGGGAASDIIGWRITQYGSCARDYRNYLLSGNTIIVMGNNGSGITRGLQLMNDACITNFLAENNTVKAGRLEAAASTIQPDACVVIQGHPIDASPWVTVRDNTFISNTCHLLFGDSYGAVGRKFQFADNEFIKYGERADFTTIRVGMGYQPANYRHKLIDNTFGAGTAVDDVDWTGSGTRWYWAGKSIYIKAVDGTTLQVIAESEVTVASAATGHASDFEDGFTTAGDGIVRLHLITHTNRPGGAANHTGHTLTIEGYRSVSLSDIFNSEGIGWDGLPNEPNTPITVNFSQADLPRPPGALGLNPNPACSGASVLASWDAVPEATGYRLYRDNTQIWQGSTTTTTFTAEAGAYSLTAGNQDGWSGRGPSTNLAVLDAAPQPRQVSMNPAIACVGGTVTVTWDEIMDASSYRLYRDGTLIWEGADTSTTIMPIPGAYTLRAGNMCGWSGHGPSYHLDVTTVPDIPGVLAISPNPVDPSNEGGNVEARWSAVLGATMYRVYRDDSQIWEGVETATTIRAYPGEYHLRAGNGCGWSDAGPTTILVVESVDQPGIPTGLVF